MTCPKCGGICRVIDTQKDGESVQRKRRCNMCGYQMYTFEVESADNGLYFHQLSTEYRMQLYNEKKEFKGMIKND